MALIQATSEYRIFSKSYLVEVREKKNSFRFYLLDISPIVILKVIKLNATKLLKLKLWRVAYKKKKHLLFTPSCDGLIFLAQCFLKYFLWWKSITKTDKS